MTSRLLAIPPANAGSRGVSIGPVAAHPLSLGPVEPVGSVSPVRYQEAATRFAIPVTSARSRSTPTLTSCSCGRPRHRGLRLRGVGTPIERLLETRLVRTVTGRLTTDLGPGS